MLRVFALCGCLVMGWARNGFLDCRRGVKRGVVCEDDFCRGTLLDGGLATVRKAFGQNAIQKTKGSIKELLLLGNGQRDVFLLDSSSVLPLIRGFARTKWRRLGVPATQ